VYFFGIDITHQKKHFIRAIMEGVAYDLRQSLDIIKEKVNLSELRAIGGGAKSELWIQIKSSIYNIPIVTLRNFEGGAIGAAILAGIGVKFFKNEKEAVRRMVKKGNKIFPLNREVILYTQYYNLYKKLHDEFQKFYVDFSKIS
jgi:xylulokinase